MENALSISRNPTQANPIKRNNILQNPIRLHTLQSPTFMEENAMTGIRRDVNQGGTVWNETLRSEEHTSELQSQSNLVCRLLLEKKKKNRNRKVINSTLRSLLKRPTHEDAKL